MKIIHTADWHIGQTFFGYDRFQEHQYFLDWLTDQITTQQIDVLLISGDIFDVAILLLRHNVNFIGSYAG